MFTVVDTKEYEKWFTSEKNGRFYKAPVVERNEYFYTLKRIDQKPARVRYEEKHGNKKTR